MNFNVAELCKLRGISIAEAARRAKISRRAVSKWQLHGVEKAQLGCIKRLADALECSIEDLIK